MTELTAPRFETDRLIIRWMEKEDAADLFAIYSHGEAMRYWGRPPFTDIAEAEKMIAEEAGEFSESSGMRLAVELKETGKVIGTCSLFAISAESRRAEIGYILSPDYWRQGIMSEALDALLHYAFVTRDLNRLEGDIDPANVASAKSLLRLGFQKEGLLRERWIVAGVKSDSELYGLLKSDWLNRP